MTRTVTLVLTDRTGAMLGSLPPFEVDVPWWPEVGVVVAGARRRWNVDATVLRLLGADRPHPPGGHVTYLAEVRPGTTLPALSPLAPGQADAALAPHPLRAPWARPGGPATTLAWAGAALADLGRPPTGVDQRKVWNLSAIWRLDTGADPVWLKQVPAFFAHEAAVLRWVDAVAPGLAPRLLAAGEDGRMLLDHAPGEDRHSAPAAERGPMLDDLHRIQAYGAKSADELLALDVPDRRTDALTPLVEATAARHGAGVEPGMAGELDRLVTGLGDRLAEVVECGVPDTLVHGDFHPGNVRTEAAGGEHRVIIDWGDAVVGHPAMDILRTTENLAPDDAGPLIAAWARRWREHTPGCDPEHALDLMRPVVALQYAAVYDLFLEQIEPAEWPYHSADPLHYLVRAVELERAAQDRADSARRS